MDILQLLIIEPYLIKNLKKKDYFLLFHFLKLKKLLLNKEQKKVLMKYIWKLYKKNII